jgi:hypothetical protein
MLSAGDEAKALGSAHYGAQKYSFVRRSTEAAIDLIAWKAFTYTLPPAGPPRN